MDTVPNIEMYENVFSTPKEIFEQLEKEIDYLLPEESQVKIYNKVYPVPRQLAAYGDSALMYKFSGLTVSCKPWSPLLLDIKSTVEEISGSSYNFVLINRYKDGNSCIGQHKDNENTLSASSPICSASFGEKRSMIFKRPKCDDYKIELEDNSLLVMKPPTNKYWTHGIPREKESKGVRVSLTFRKMVTSNKRKSDETLDKNKKHAFKLLD